MIHVSNLRCMRWITPMNDHGFNHFVHLMHHMHTQAKIGRHLWYQEYCSLSHTNCKSTGHTKQNGWKAIAESKFCNVAALLKGHRRRSGLIQRSLCVPTSLSIKMLSTRTLLYTHTAQSESILCQREERDTQKREERKSKSSCASDRDKWEWSKDMAGSADSPWGGHLNIKVPTQLSWKINGHPVIFIVYFSLLFL